jgi:hypothetical protein
MENDSAQVGAHFWRQGYKNVRVILGGIDMLRKAGFQWWVREK